MAVRQARASASERGAQTRAQPDSSYAAFVSYSHAASGRLAPALQHGLRQLGRPWYRPPDIRIFRDETGLTATPALWPSIEQGLASSRWFLLLASPRAAASVWVATEAQWWLDHVGTDRVLIALTDGEMRWDATAGRFDRTITTALPECLLDAFETEPRWVDLRWAQTTERLTLRHARFRDSVAELAAPLRGVTKEALLDDDVREQRRRNRWRNATISGLVLLTLLACIFGVVAVQQRNTAVHQRDVATSRQLAAVAAAVRPTQPDLALLLALEGIEQQPTDEARAALQAGLSEPMHPSWTLAGHSDIVSDVAVSPDGLLVATSGGNGQAWVWRVVDGAVALGPVQHGTAIVYSTAISATGLLATGGSDGTARIWDLEDGSSVAPPLAAGTSVNAVAFSPDGGTLATGDNSGYLRLWDVATGDELISTLADADGVTSIRFTRDGGSIVTGGFSGTVQRWAAADLGAQGPAIVAGTAPTSMLAMDIRPDGAVVATAEAGDTVRLWDLDTGQPHGVGQLEASDARALAFSPDGTKVAAASGNVVRLWDTTRGREIGEPFTGSTDYLLAVAFTPDGRHLVAGGADRVPRIWDVATAQPVGRVLAEDDGVFDVDFHAGLLAAGNTGQVTVYDRRNGRTVEGPLPTAAGGTTAAFSPDGRLLASGDFEGTLRLWHLPGGRQAGDDVPTQFPLYDVAFSPDGALIATGGFEGTVRLWNATTLQAAGALEPPGDSATAALAYDPHGRLVAGASLDGPVHLWEVDTLRLVRSLTDQDEASTAVAFSPDGATLAQGTSDGALRLWDPDAGVVVCTMPDDERAWVETVAFSPDGSLLASGSDADTVRLWDVDTCTPASAAITGFGDDVTAVAFRDDGRELAAASIDGTVRLARTPETWTAAGCDLARRNLTLDEWRTYRTGPYEKTCPRWAGAQEAGG